MGPAQSLAPSFNRTQGPFIALRVRALSLRCNTLQTFADGSGAGAIRGRPELKKLACNTAV